MLPAAPLKRRFAALCYELLLIGAVSCAAFIPAGILALFLNQSAPQLSSLLVTLVILYAWWLYFKINWHKKGQTLAMQVWRIGLLGRRGRGGARGAPRGRGARAVEPAEAALYLGLCVFGFCADAGLCRAEPRDGRAAENGGRCGFDLVDSAVGFRAFERRPSVFIRLFGGYAAGGCEKTG